MKGAYEAMRTGYVDEAWAKEHHELWYDDIQAGKIPAQRSTPPAAPGATGRATPDLHEDHDHAQTPDRRAASPLLLAGAGRWPSCRRRATKPRPRPPRPRPRPRMARQGRRPTSCARSMDTVAAALPGRREEGRQGRQAAPPRRRACADPGPFVYTPPRPRPPAAAARIAAGAAAAPPRSLSRARRGRWPRPQRPVRARGAPSRPSLSCRSSRAVPDAPA